MALALCALLVCSASAFHSPIINERVTTRTSTAVCLQAMHSGTSISYDPSGVVLDGATISYPETLMGKLFSSVPKRPHAVDDITASFGTSNANRVPTILVGRSASGKSTLLRLICGDDVPTSGSVEIDGLARPVIIDRKPPMDDSKSVLDGIMASGMQKKGGQKGTNEHDVIVQQVATDLATTLGLTSQQLQSKPSSLSPSGLFLFGLACGCIRSVMPALDAIGAQRPDTDNSSSSLPGPILLLDELFDFEHPDVPAKCCPGIDSLVQDLGAVVIIATHKPHHWESLESRRVVALSSGRILSEETVGKGKTTTMVYK